MAQRASTAATKLADDWRVTCWCLRLTASLLKPVQLAMRQRVSVSPSGAL